MLTIDRNPQSLKGHGPATMTFAALIVAIALAAIQTGLGTTQENQEKQEKTESAVSASTAPSRAQLKDKQLDVSLEARDIERVLGKLKRASDLSKKRITDASLVAESASGALDRGDSKAARSDAQQAAGMFQEIAKQLEALLAEETPQRVAAAQNLAQQLSQAERQFMRQFPGTLNQQQSGGKGKIDQRSQIRPQTNPNQKQTGSGGQQNQLPKKSDESKTKQGAGGSKDQAKVDSGNAESKKDMPPNGSGKDGDMPQDGDQKKQDEKKQDGNNGSPGEPKDGKGADKKKSDMPRGGEGGGEKKDDTDNPSQNGFGALTEEQQREALARRAEELAESGKTLEDILKAIAQSTDPADAEAVRMIEAVVKETNLSQAIANMQQAAGTIRSGKLDDARLASLDVADRMEIASQRLGSAYRLIVAPQAEELRDAEQMLADLREKLEQLETPSQVAAWHREARELLDKLDKLGVSDEIREEFIEEMKKAGFNTNLAGGLVSWEVANGHYVAPQTYARALIHLQEEVQARLQNLLLGDLDSSPDEATPPKYQELVDRYYQVLSRESGRGNQRSSSAPSTKK